MTAGGVRMTAAHAVVVPAGDPRGRPISAKAPGGDAPGMTLPPNPSQRDLVRLAVLLCGERTGAKYRPPVKAAG